MNSNSIIHFVGFNSRLNREEFIDQWTQYAKNFTSTPGSVTLQEKNGKQGRFNYISQHVFEEEDFRFSFMKDRASENFPEQRGKVTMLGGYSPARIGHTTWREKTEIKVLVFLTNDRTDAEYFPSLYQTSSLNIYEPFYENCVYSRIVELFYSKAAFAAISDELLKRKDGEEISIYDRCRIPSLVS